MLDYGNMYWQYAQVYNNYYILDAHPEFYYCTVENFAGNCLDFVVVLTHFENRGTLAAKPADHLDFYFGNFGWQWY